MESFLKTQQISVYTPRINWAEWIVQLAVVGNHHFQSFFCHKRAKILPTWPKNELAVNPHPTSVDTKFELPCLNTFSDNSQKPPFAAILRPLEGQNLASVAQNQIKYEK